MHDFCQAKAQRQSGEWQSFILKEGKTSGVPKRRLLACGSQRQTNQKWGHLIRLVWAAHLAFFSQSWVEAGIKLREASSHWPNPDPSWQNAVETVIWLPELVAAKAVGNSNIIIYDLDIVHYLILLYQFQIYSILLFNLWTSYKIVNIYFFLYLYDSHYLPPFDNYLLTSHSPKDNLPLLPSLSLNPYNTSYVSAPRLKNLPQLLCLQYR